MRSLRGSETAGKNGPGYEGAAHGKQGSILAEGGGFVAGGFKDAVSLEDCIHAWFCMVRVIQKPLIFTSHRLSPAR